MNSKTTLKLEGMTCSSCAQTIEKALNKTDGVDQAQVNFAAEKAYVDYDSSKVDENKLVEVVKGTGYDVKQERESNT